MFTIHVCMHYEMLCVGCNSVLTGYKLDIVLTMCYIADSALSVYMSI